MLMIVLSSTNIFLAQAMPSTFFLYHYKFWEVFTFLSTADSQLSPEARIGTTIAVVMVVLLIFTIIIVGVVSITVGGKSAGIL